MKRKKIIFALLNAREQREHGFPFLRIDGGGDDGGSGGDDGDQGDDDGGSDDDAGDDGKKQGDDLANLSQADLAKMVRDLRREAGSDRTTAKQRAADQARADLVQQLGKTLGLVKDGDAKPDAAKLTETLTARETALREATTENAVLKTAPRHGADPGALVDSREFMRRASALDPDDDKFGSKLADLIKKAVADSPTRYAATSPGASSPEVKNGGGSKTTQPKSLHEAVKARMGG